MGEGCASLGVAYQRGTGVKRDSSRAAALFRQACDGGQLLGCSHLGALYASGDGKVALGCVGLARLHAAGTGVPQNDSTAALLFKQACDANEATGCFHLAAVNETGQGVAQNFQRAAHLYCEACYRLAELHQKGAGVYRSPQEATAMRRRACDFGYAEACPKPNILANYQTRLTRNR